MKQRCFRTIWVSSAMALMAFFAACDEQSPTPGPRRWPSGEEGNRVSRECILDRPLGIPVVYMPRFEPVDTYLVPGTRPAALGIDYIATPPSTLRRLEIVYDFDPLTPIAPARFDIPCIDRIPFDAFMRPIPGDLEDVVTAEFVEHESAEWSVGRRGRITTSTGRSRLVLSTEGVDPGRAEDGSWWALFEPAPGNPRLLLVPADVMQSTVEIPGVPEGQPGRVALIQSDEIQYDPTLGVIVAPSAYRTGWWLSARAWYGAVLLEQPSGAVSLEELIPTGSDRESLFGNTRTEVLADGREREIHDIPSRRETEVVFEISCDATDVAIRVLTFAEVTVDGMNVIPPGGSAEIRGACEDARRTWPLRLRGFSINGQPPSVMFVRRSEVLP